MVIHMMHDIQLGSGPAGYLPHVILWRSSRYRGNEKRCLAISIEFLGRLLASWILRSTYCVGLMTSYTSNIKPAS